MNDAENPEGERLQKVLSRAGVASRRRVEWLMAEGRVSVNGSIATEMGMRIHSQTDVVSVDGKVISLKVEARYVMLHKPVGVVSSLADEQGRPDLGAYLDDIGERVFNVGRLDIDTSGLLMLTNDGEATHRLAHPSFEVDKVYTATVAGSLTPAGITQLLAGWSLKTVLRKPIRPNSLVNHHEGPALSRLSCIRGKTGSCAVCSKR